MIACRLALRRLILGMHIMIHVITSDDPVTDYIQAAPVVSCGPILLLYIISGWVLSYLELHAGYRSWFGRMRRDLGLGFSILFSNDTGTIGKWI